MKSDIEIAREIKLSHIKTIAENIGIHDDQLHYYGKFKAKVDVVFDEERIAKSNLILVTAITPNSITLDAPITTPLDPAYGQGYIVP